MNIRDIVVLIILGSIFGVCMGCTTPINRGGYRPRYVKQSKPPMKPKSLVIPNDPLKGE
jgi:hypothetical protein